MILFMPIIVIIGCTQSVNKSSHITIACVRDNDTIHLKITNNTSDTLYIPPSYIGTYNTDGDTIFLEMVDKPRFNTNNYYLYKKLLPFGVYLTKKIAGVIPDSTITVQSQTYYFNQFLVQPFTIVLPHSSYITSIVFYVPKGPGILQAVYYKQPFHPGNKEPKTANYLLEDWIKFDSTNAKYASCEIANRVYLKPN
jgi:hypothetical protein